MPDPNPFLDFSDADLKAALRRAIRFTAVLAVAGAAIFAVTMGWQTGALFLAGSAVSATGIYEWQQLIAILNAKLDKQQTPRSAGFVLTMFCLRLGIAAVVIYGSLRCFHGSLYALVAGLALAVVALTVEAVRLVIA
jgi:hypothetical protein